MSKTRNPFLSLWFRPRRTIGRISARDPRRHVVPISCVVGIVTALNLAAMTSLGDSIPVDQVVFCSLLLGAFGGAVILWVFSDLVRVSGAWLGGRATADELRAAVVWGTVPTLVLAPLWVVVYSFVGADLFTTATPKIDADPSLRWATIAFGTIAALMTCWQVFAQAKMVAEVQAFRSSWRALGNLALAALMMLIVLLFAAVAMGIITPTVLSRWG